jgi:hypothetical protein
MIVQAQIKTLCKLLESTRIPPSEREKKNRLRVQPRPHRKNI